MKHSKKRIRKHPHNKSKGHLKKHVKRNLGKRARKQRQRNRRQRIVATNSTIQVLTQFFKKSRKITKQEASQNTIEIHRFVTEPAYVRVGSGMTINLGGFQFARVDVSVNLPCYKEELDKGYEFALNMVSEKLSEKVDEIIQGREGKAEEKDKNAKENPTSGA